MPFCLVELWSSADAAIISPFQGDMITNNIANPTSFAGASWSYKSDVQFLSADGPIDEDVVIKVNTLTLLLRLP